MEKKVCSGNISCSYIDIETSCKSIGRGGAGAMEKIRNLFGVMVKRNPYSLITQIMLKTAGKNIHLPFIRQMGTQKETRAVTKCDLIPPSSALTETSNTDGHGQKHGRKDRQDDSSIPPKAFVLQGYKEHECTANEPFDMIYKGRTTAKKLFRKTDIGLF